MGVQDGVQIVANASVIHINDVTTVQCMGSKGVVLSKCVPERIWKRYFD